MKLRSYLFIASIVLLAGCGNESGKTGIELQQRLDSANVAHQNEIDLLQQQIRTYESEIDVLKGKSQLLEDSLAILKKTKAESKVGPKISPKTHLGDPVRDTKKK